VIQLARRVADSRAFQNLVMAVILLTAVLVGLETSEELSARYAWFFHGAELVVQTIFVIEIAVRLLAHGPRPHRFFADGWNVFDFTVVVASLLPQAGPYAVVARLARLLRVTRLVSAFPELRLIVSTMLRSIPSMGHVIMMLSLLLYVYGVVGVYMFRDEDPEHWGSLGAATLTLFQILTLEGWVELQDELLPTHPFAWVYFASFVFIGVFVVVNLFIAVVINNLESAKLEHQTEADRRDRQADVFQALADVRERLDHLERLVRHAGPDGTSAPHRAAASRAAVAGRTTASS
jgi:voltage-gated sodium channel